MNQYGSHLHRLVLRCDRLVFVGILSHMPSRLAPALRTSTAVEPVKDFSSFTARLNDERQTPCVID